MFLYNCIEMYYLILVHVFELKLLSILKVNKYIIEVNSIPSYPLKISQIYGYESLRCLYYYIKVYYLMLVYRVES